MRFGLALAAGSVLAVFATLSPSVAHADIQHVIGKGHTIEAIAHRYHVSVKDIIEANHLKDVKHLKVGDVLIIPKVDAKREGAGDKKHDGEKGGHDKDKKEG